jgi:hypothetical protein
MSREAIVPRQLLFEISTWCILATLLLSLLSSLPCMFVSAGKILVVGATGTTGIRALRGLLDVYEAQNLILLTRNANQPRILQLKEMGFGIIQADLEDETLLRKQVLQQYHDDTKKNLIWEGCYIHSTTSDIPDLDTLEVSRAENLCLVLMEIAKQNRQVLSEKNDASTVPFVVVYNSAAAPPNHGVRRITQKHQVENVFQSAIMSDSEISTLPSSLSSSSSKSLSNPPSPSLIFVSLRANIFMEELWKSYTRPSILGGKYPLPLNGWTPIYLTSVRDMGRLAGLWIRQYRIMRGQSKILTTRTRTSPPGCVVIQNVAGDFLRGPQIAKAFGQVQRSPCQHVNTHRSLTKQAKTSFPELYQQILYIQRNHKEKTYIDALNEQIPSNYPFGMTNFAAFLQETDWGNEELTFDDLSRVDALRDG